MGRVGEKWIVGPGRIFSGEEIRELRMCARSGADKSGWRSRSRVLEHIAVEIGIGSGLRVSEVAGLACDDLALGQKAGSIFVRRGKCGKPRQVIISAGLCRVLRKYLSWKSSRGEPTGDGDPLLVSSHTGGHLTTRALQKMFGRVMRRAGVPRRRFHDMRHTYGTFLLKSSGNDLVFVKEQMGHSDLTTTAVYLHALNAEKAVNALYS